MLIQHSGSIPIEITQINGKKHVIYASSRGEAQEYLSTASKVGATAKRVKGRSSVPQWRRDQMKPSEVTITRH